MDLISTNYTTDAEASSPCVSDDDKVDTSENLKELPRIGDMFQAQVPPLSVEYAERTSCLLHIPIMWAHLDFVHSNKKVLEHRASLECIDIEDKDITSKGRDPFPGSLGEHWSELELERESFVLGLYIFGKNMKFVECKDTGDVLSFYYGDFYRSDRYHKWAQFLKRRNTRSLHGHKIFSAGKLQELFSRLAHHISEKCRLELLEVSRKFEEGKLPLEEFVNTLKNAVGIDKLIEAVGIGRGKQDLTAATAVQKTVQPTKPKKTLSSIRKMPFLKACSKLSTGDIVKLLTGDSSLGKARSNDLFWEAVWPRLLARGWHSEYRNRHGDPGLKDNLVFLIPGIEKFNRRRLRKGQHYFDTLNEILSKVALNPLLLNLPSETTEDRREETEEQQNSNSDDSDETEMTFTIVDTRLFSGVRITKTRKLKKSIVNCTEKGFGSISCSSEDEHNTPKESGDDSSVRETCANAIECVTSTVNNSSHNALDSTEENPIPTSCFSNEGQTAVSSKYEVSVTAKCVSSSCSNASVPQEPHHKTKTMSLNSEKKKDNVISRVASSDHVPESRNERPRQQPKPLKLLVKGPSRIKPQPTVQELRQSTRSRPLTTKALEAIESGFALTPNKKRKIIERMAKNDTRIANLSPV